MSEAVFNKVTKGVTVSSDDVHQYYVAHPQLYSQPQTRDVQYILVKKKALAQSIHSQLKNGVWSVKLVSNTPNRIGRICLNGSGCANNTDRELLDLFEVAEDPLSNKAAIIYTSSEISTYTAPDSTVHKLPEIVLAFEQ